MTTARGTVTELNLFSKELNEEIKMLVYLPATFSPLYKYSLSLHKMEKIISNLEEYLALRMSFSGIEKSKT